MLDAMLSIDPSKRPSPSYLCSKEPWLQKPPVPAQREGEEDGPIFRGLGGMDGDEEMDEFEQLPDDCVPIERQRARAPEEPGAAGGMGEPSAEGGMAVGLS